MMRTAPRSTETPRPAGAPNTVRSAAPRPETASPVNSSRENGASPAAIANTALTIGLTAFRIVAVLAKVQWSAW